jgi:predicted nucleic acid-binding protein
LTLYLDTSVVVPLFLAEAWSERAEAFLSGSPIVTISDYSEVEFASAISRRVRMGDIEPTAGQTALAQFDTWIRRAQRAVLSSDDLVMAKTFLRRLDLRLRTGDAIHIAIAQRVGATLATFDKQMSRCAAMLDIPIVP